MDTAFLSKTSMLNVPKEHTSVIPTVRVGVMIRA